MWSRGNGESVFKCWKLIQNTWKPCLRSKAESTLNSKPEPETLESKCNGQEAYFGPPT